MARTGLLAALLVAGLGCGGGDPCADSSCPNDPRQTAAQYQDCVNTHNANKNKTCAAESVNAELCVLASRVCTSAGKTDLAATASRYNSNCQAVQERLSCCVLAATGFATCR